MNFITYNWWYINTRLTCREKLEPASASQFVTRSLQMHFPGPIHKFNEFLIHFSSALLSHKPSQSSLFIQIGWCFFQWVLSVLLLLFSALLRVLNNKCLKLPRAVAVQTNWEHASSWGRVNRWLSYKNINITINIVHRDCMKI